jgi:hypothetical protein
VRSRGLTAERAVARRLVHKLALEQVFATGAVRIGEDEWAALVQLPRANRLFNDTLQPYPDLLLLCEAARQGVMVVLHECLDVPLDLHFVTTRLDVRLDDLDANLPGPLPTEMTIAVSFDSERRHRDGSLRAVQGEARCHVGEARAGTFAGALRFLPRTTYTAARDGAPSSSALKAERPARAEPRAVGRSDPRNVVVAPPEPDGGGYVVLASPDPADPVFFDHPQDHYPGMLLLEVARQAAIASAAAATGERPERFVPLRATARFGRFAELGEPLRCHAEVTERGPARIALALRLEQRGERLAPVAVELAVVGDGATADHEDAP